jgi:hypothetical protein
VRDWHEAAAPEASGGAYVNFIPEAGGGAGDAYGPNHARLAEVKERWDPTNLFRLNQNVRPAGGGGSASRAGRREARREP